MNKAFVINIDSRPEQFEEVQREFEPYGIECERFAGIQRQPGFVGCALSHLELIERAKKNNWPWIMVFEDDCVARDAMKHWPIISKFLMKESDRWDLFVGGGLYVYPKKLQNDFKKGITAKIDIVECPHAMATHFMIYNKSSYDRILAWHQLPLPAEERPSIDNFIQACNFRKWLPVPFVAWQKPQHSALINQFIDYGPQFKRAEHKMNYFTQEIKKSLKYKLGKRWMKVI